MPSSSHSSRPLPERRHVAEVAARDHDPVRHLPVELLDDLHADRLLALDAQAVHRVREVDAVALGDLLHDLHAAVEVGLERERDRAVGHRLEQLRERDLVARQEHDRGNARRTRRRRRARPRCRRSTRRRPPRMFPPRLRISFTTDTSTVMPRSLKLPVCELPHCLTQRSSTPHCWPSRLAQNRLVWPSNIETTFVLGHDRADQLPLAPDAGTVRPFGRVRARLEDLHPLLRRGLLQPLEVVLRP